MDVQQRFERMIAARHACVCISTIEEEFALQMIAQASINTGKPFYVWTVTKGLYDGLLAGAAPIPGTDHPAAALFHLAQSERDRKGIIVMLDLAGHLRDERTLRILREATRKVNESGGMVVLLDAVCELPEVIRAVASALEIPFPDEEEIERLVRAALRKVNEDKKIVVDMSRTDLNTIVRNLCGLTRRQIRQIVTDVAMDDARFDRRDVEHALALKRSAMANIGLLEHVEAPTSMDEIGGLGKLKEWLRKRQNSMGEQAAKYGLRAPRGLLMLGVQGAGKSLASKAVATAWQRPLMRLDVGRLYDRYIGESEKRLRDALRQAEASAPIVLRIDEIEKAFASAASQSTDGGLSKRMFGSLLTWMQEHEAPVFLIATANDIDALPPELLRKGRFDGIFFVDLPPVATREQILAIHLRKRDRDPQKFDLARIASVSEGFSGAEIEQAIASAMHDAFDQREEVTTEHIVRAIESSPPLSVTMAERIAQLRAWASGRCVPAE
jgi:SpoVK/Ycf46/Vps4 family AAA+-type ATPase